jgi:hypothetical protein
LIVYWNGTAWAQMASASPANAIATVLNGIACSTPTSCVAVGETYLGSASAYSTLVETLTGTSWSIVPSPNPTSPANNSLSAVSCACTSSCYAVGTASSQTLVEQYS